MPYDDFQKAMFLRQILGLGPSPDVQRAIEARQRIGMPVDVPQQTPPGAILGPPPVPQGPPPQQQMQGPPPMQMPSPQTGPNPAALAYQQMLGGRGTLANWETMKGAGSISPQTEALAEQLIGPGAAQLRSLQAGNAGLENRAGSLGRALAGQYGDVLPYRGSLGNESVRPLPGGGYETRNPLAPTSPETLYSEMRRELPFGDAMRRVLRSRPELRNEHLKWVYGQLANRQTTAPRKPVDLERANRLLAKYQAKPGTVLPAPTPDQLDRQRSTAMNRVLEMARRQEKVKQLAQRREMARQFRMGRPIQVPGVGGDAGNVAMALISSGNPDLIKAGVALQQSQQAAQVQGQQWSQEMAAERNRQQQLAKLENRRLDLQDKAATASNQAELINAQAGLSRIQLGIEELRQQSEQFREMLKPENLKIRAMLANVPPEQYEGYMDEDGKPSTKLRPSQVPPPANLADVSQHATAIDNLMQIFPDNPQAAKTQWLKWGLSTEQLRDLLYESDLENKGGEERRILHRLFGYGEMLDRPDQIAARRRRVAYLKRLVPK